MKLIIKEKQIAEEQQDVDLLKGEQLKKAVDKLNDEIQRIVNYLHDSEVPLQVANEYIEDKAYQDSLTKVSKNGMVKLADIIMLTNVMDIETEWAESSKHMRKQYENH